MSETSTHRVLIVFGREPRPGRVKTRLIPALGAKPAAKLYERLLRHTLSAGANIAVDQKQLWLDEVRPEGSAITLARSHGFAVFAQQGGDLGERMARAFEQALASATQVVLIGSDCPGYTPAYLESAFAALRDHDAVIGPAADGGYVMLGLRQLSPDLFEDVPWSTGEVLTVTRARLSALNWSWHELAVQHDIDEPTDLRYLPSNLSPLRQP